MPTTKVLLFLHTANYYREKLTLSPKISSLFFLSSDFVISYVQTHRLLMMGFIALYDETYHPYDEIEEKG